MIRYTLFVTALAFAAMTATVALVGCEAETDLTATGNRAIAPVDAANSVAVANVTDPGSQASAEPSNGETGEATSPAPSTEPMGCGFSLNRALAATDVQDREPVGVNGPFEASGQPVYIFVDVHNPDGPEQTLTFEWNHPASGHTYSQTMDAGVSPRWRTWVRHRVRDGQHGAWTVDVLTADGCSLDRVTFEVAEGEQVDG